jgi:hypothetical protein
MTTREVEAKESGSENERWPLHSRHIIRRSDELITGQYIKALPGVVTHVMVVPPAAWL